MLRYHKTYEFGKVEGLPASLVTFTSRPGDISSKDDFFLLDSNMAVL
jgi:hypothetical protein